MKDTKGYELSAKLDMEYAPRKISLPEGFVSKQEFPVQKHHLDTNHHVNKKLDMEYAPRKISLPEGFVSKQEFPVQKHHLDTNHHVNNCQYVCMAEDYLPEGFNLHQMRAEYKKQARLGDVIYPGVYAAEDKVVVLLDNENGEAYAALEFMK